MVDQQIHIPTLLLDPQRCKANIRLLADKANAQGIILRPHFKTHQSHEVGRWFKSAGIDQITVSSVGMASYFAADGWQDITIALPVNIRELETINQLAARCRLGILVLDTDTVAALGQGLHHPVEVWIKIDVGTHRTGLDPADMETINRILTAMEAFPMLSPAGFLAHAGHTYHCRTDAEVRDIYQTSLQILTHLRQAFNNRFPALRISLGDTPGASIMEDLGPVDELRPGNFVFYDLMQEQIGACTLEDIAVAMACPVVAVHPDRLQWIIYGGAIHFSKERLTMDNGQACYGRMVEPSGASWSVTHSKQLPYLAALSQEHGVVQCTRETFHRCKPGDLSLWLPVHSCLTADAMGGYVDTDGHHIDHYRSVR